MVRATYKKDILMANLSRFYTQSNTLEKILPILFGESKISLRLIDWFVTNYAKKRSISYVIKEKDEFGNDREELFIVHLNYKSQLKAYSKKQFDPFCRNERIFYNDKKENILTTIGQFNFFRWAIKNNIINYIDENHKEIEKDMNECMKEVRRKSQIKKDHKMKVKTETDGKTKHIKTSKSVSINLTNENVNIERTITLTSK